MAAGAGEGAPARLAPPGVDAWAVLWMVTLTFIWGLNAISIKVLTGGMAPLMAAGLRGTIAWVLLTGFCLLRGESFRFGRRVLLHSAAAATIFTLEAVLLYQGARFTSGGHIAIFINTAPFFVAAGAHYLLPGERLHAIRLGGLCLAFAGVVLLFSDGLLVAGSGFWRGDLLVMGAAFMWASTTLYVKGVLADKLSAPRLMWVRMTVSSPQLLAASLLFEREPFHAVTPAVLGSLIFQGTVVVFFSYMMWVRVLQRYPASAVQPFTFLTPVWGVLAGVVLLSETVSLPMAGGIALVGGGLYLVSQNPRARGAGRKMAGRETAGSPAAGRETAQAAGNAPAGAESGGPTE